jgi:Tol biopolymer transport system component
LRLLCERHPRNSCFLGNIPMNLSLHSRMRLILAAVFTALLLAACSGTTANLPQPTAVPTNLPVPTITPTAVQTNTPLPSATPTPTATPRPSRTPIEALRAVSLLPAGYETPVPQVKAYRIVYVQQGDLWYLEEGRPPARLTKSGSVLRYHYQPESQWIYYVEDDRYGRNGLWAVNFQGSTRRLAVPPLVTGEIFIGSVSSDGALIAFTLAPGENGDGEIWAAATNGSRTWRVLSGEQLCKLNPLDWEVNFGHMTGRDLQWVQGSHTLLYDIYPVIYDGNYWRPMDLRGYDVDRRQAVEAPYSSSPIFSPDGQTVVITEPGTLTFMRPDGSDPRPAGVDYFQIGMGGYLMEPPLQWLPDSSGVLLAQPVGQPYSDEYADAPPVEIWRVPADGSPAVKLVTVSTDAIAFNQIGFSPNGQFLQYRASSKAGDKLALRIVRLPTETEEAPMEILYDREMGLSAYWSPDNRHFIFNRGDGSLPPDWMLGDLAGRPKYLPLDHVWYDLQAWLDNQRFLMINTTDWYDCCDYYLGDVNGSVEYLLSTDRSIQLLTVLP